MKALVLCFFLGSFVLASSQNDPNLENTVAATVYNFFYLMPKCTEWMKLFTNPTYIEDPFRTPSITDVQDLYQGCLAPSPFSRHSLSLTRPPYVSQDGASTLWVYHGVTRTGCSVLFEGSDVFTTNPQGTHIAKMIGYFNTTEVGEKMAKCGIQMNGLRMLM